MGIAIVVAVILWTTARHELSHALVAWMRGNEVTSLRWWPGSSDGAWSLGAVTHVGPPHWTIDAAPYLVDVLLILIAALTLAVARGSVVRRVVLLALVISPVADLIWGWVGTMGRSGSDGADLIAASSAVWVHAAFALAVAAGVVVLRRSRVGRDRGMDHSSEERASQSDSLSHDRRSGP
ncbi:MAG TPA: hypothetical protein VJ976_02295 [Ornithinimicrobium sp.]|uniref:hypothetical protein n=1 Tax=Ornithinimicrobium sp. TaxID=1977084 RepID=UPI002B488F71|nr:hypothetical protein [Ornithinimicrobium sp.]HKJ11200.1 hypothetical protein [Ornithinimicrobium sp.]